jgi:hypothetical protein
MILGSGFGGFDALNVVKVCNISKSTAVFKFKGLFPLMSCLTNFETVARACIILQDFVSFLYGISAPPNLGR